MPTTSFDVNKHAYGFANDFINVFNLIGGVNITTAGRCGGMCYTALDYFHKDVQAPRLTQLPPADSRVARHVMERQWASLWNVLPHYAHLLTTLSPSYWWENVASATPNVMQAVRAEIDAKRPVNLGLLALGAFVFNPGVNHQVLAIGYNQGSTPYDFEIDVYDPNHPGVTRRLRPDPTSKTFEFQDSRSGKVWGTFFADLGYRPGDLPENKPVTTQLGWRWCQKCEGLHYASAQRPTGPCPAGGTHSTSGSGKYRLPHSSSSNYDLPEYGQGNWRWCQACEGLHFEGQTFGPCPKGPGLFHVSVNSGSYSLVHNSPMPPDIKAQVGWRWCNRCFGLVFGRSTNPGRCPAGDGKGKHSTTGSGDYTLWYE